MNDFLDGYIGVKPPTLSSPSLATPAKYGVYIKSFYGFDVCYFIGNLPNKPYKFFSLDGWTEDESKIHYFAFVGHAFDKLRELEN